MKKLKPHPVDWAQIGRFLCSADKKLASARKTLAFDEEAYLQQAYEAMLKASLGLMFSHGFRARSQPGTSPSSISCDRALTRNMLVCRSSLIVSAGSAIQPFLTGPDLSLTVMLSSSRIRRRLHEADRSGHRKPKGLNQTPMKEVRTFSNFQTMISTGSFRRPWEPTASWNQ
jgi:hypothetical protein